MGTGTSRLVPVPVDNSKTIQKILIETVSSINPLICKIKKVRQEERQWQEAHGVKVRQEYIT